ncbi:MAG TPA: hypothetical protein VGZ73_25660 [Bryobacteraceae bacterium]|jgi:hypothetical protein|nr:hypothetical protein [Bryobacteraceae bacterium]
MDQIGSLLDRPKQYYNIDGVGELGIGFMLLSFALLGSLQEHSLKGAIWHQMWLFVIYLGVMFSIIHYGSKAIKNHITYPRTGFVEYRARDSWRPGLLAAVVAPLFLAVLVIRLRWHWAFTTPASLICLLFAAGYARGFVRTARWKWTVVWAMACGSLTIALLPSHSWIITFFDATFVGAFWFSMTLCGAVFLASGSSSSQPYCSQSRSPISCICNMKPA